MNKGINLHGAKDVLKTIQKISAKCEKTVPKQIHKAALEIEREAVNIHDPNVDTGRLKGSIQTVKDDDTHYEVSAGGMKVDGKEVDYAGYLEFGTKNTRAYPFMRPAATKVQNKYTNIIILGVEDGIKQGGVK